MSYELLIYNLLLDFKNPNTCDVLTKITLLDVCPFLTSHCRYSPMFVRSELCQTVDEFNCIG